MKLNRILSILTTLEHTASAAKTNRWGGAPQAVVDTASERTVTVPAAGVIKCYRLKN
jgi:hypothetical protein